MKLVECYEELVPMLSDQLRRGVITNAFLSGEDWRREIAAGTLRYERWEDGLLLLRRRKGFDLLSFFLQKPYLPTELSWDGPAVLEIAARPKDQALCQIIPLWYAQGFVNRFRRERLFLPANTPVPEGSGPLVVRVAFPSEIWTVQSLLRECFDPMTGCLPTDDDLERAMCQGGVVCAMASDGQMAGLLHIDSGRNMTQLRHLAVRERYRRQGGAQGLLARYLKHTGFAKSVVWVRSDNLPARRFYSKNGYSADGWTSTVLYRP